jgi:hypothetical protein
MGTNTLPAQELGVPLFCVLDLDTVTISAQELGVNYTVLYETTSVSYVGTNSVSAPELGVSLLCVQNSDQTSIPRVASNYSASYESVLDVFTFLKVSDLSVLEFTTMPASVSDYQHLNFVLQVDSDKGRFEVEHCNIGVYVVTCMLRLLTLSFQLVSYVLRALTVLSKYLYIGLYQVLTLFTPHSKWWPQYLYRLNLLVINCCFTLHKTVAEKCRRVRASLLRNLFRRYNFLVVQASICRVRRFTVIFIIASCLSLMFDCMHDPSVIVASDMGEPGPEFPTWEHAGGGRIPLFNLEELLPHVDCSGKIVAPDSNLRFVGHKHKNVAEALYSALGDHVYGKVPLDQFVVKLTLKDAKSIAKIHRVHVPSKFRAENIAAEFKGHSCAHCDSYVSVFTLHSVKTDSENSKKWYAGLDASQKQKKQKNNKASIEQKKKKAENMKLKREAGHSKLPDFPPPPPSDQLQEIVALNWCEDTSPSKFMEGGCAVCGQLVPLVQLSGLYDS